MTIKSQILISGNEKVASMDEKEAKKTAKLATNQIIKSINSLLGIVSGLVSDGDLNDKEIIFLKMWCSENSHIANQYPANIIFRRVHEVLLDGVITQEEREHLLHELITISGNDFFETGSAMPEIIKNIFDDDPTVIFPDNEFVLTGGFMFGTRPVCEAAVVHRGGMVKDYVTEKTNYLVIGTRASPDWIAENFGRKIQRAAEMANSGDYDISIILEADWAMSLK
jgi:NAD-dependent DNA ligase